MKLLSRALTLICGLVILAGCGPEKGGAVPKEKTARPAGKTTQPDATSKTTKKKPKKVTKKDPEPEPEENVTASKESVVKVKRLLRRWVSEVEEERAEAWEGLKDMGDLATPALIEVIKAGKPEQKRMAIIAVGLLKDKLGAPAIRGALSDGDAGVRWAAARSLGEIGDAGAKPFLVKAMKEDQDAEVRYHAAYALAGLGGKQAFEYFKKHLESQKTDDRSRAVRALGKYGNGKYVAELTKALKDKEYRVRYAAVVQLDRARKKEVVPPLIAALEDDDYRVRKRARSALERLTGKDFGRAKAKWEKWWKQEGKKFKPAARTPAASGGVAFTNSAPLAGEEDFKKKVTGSQGWVAVVFYSAKGKMCATHAPGYDKLAKDYKGKMTLYHAEARANAATIKALGIKVPPTTVFYRDGKKIETLAGSKSEAELKAVIDGHLSGERKVHNPDGKPAFADVKDAADFKEKVEESKGVVLVNFHAEWCVWCHVLTPVLNELMVEYQGKVTFVGVDTVKSKDLAKKFEAKALPTMIIFKDGRQAEKLTGFKKKPELKAILDKHLKAEGGEK